MVKDLMKWSIVLLILAWVAILPELGYAQTDSILVRYGHISALPINVDINSRVTIPVYVYTGPYNYVGDIHLALGTNDQYIDSLLSETEGVFYYPFTEWDAIYFNPIYASPPNPEGWHSQSLMGFANMVDPYDKPWLHNITLDHVADFVVKTANDSLNIGDLAAAIGVGIDLIQGHSNAGDTLGNLGFLVKEKFSQFRFTGGGYLEGTVTDYQGNTLEGISIINNTTGKETVTDTAGYYYMGHYPGTFSYTCTDPAYIPVSSSFTITEGDTIDWNVSLDMYGVISGIVTNYAGTPIVGAQVTTNGTTLTTDSTGAYSFTGLSSGSYNVLFHYSPYIDTTVTGVVAAVNTVTTLDLTMHQYADLAGTVTVASAPLQGIIVTIVGSSYVDTTNSSGAYAMADVTPGTYNVFFDSPNNYYSDTTIEAIVIGYDVNTVLDIEMEFNTGLDEDALPFSFSLNQNYPNPFNAKTTIEYSISKEAHVTLDIYDVLGRKVVNLVDEFKAPGIYKANLNASSLTSGVYFYKLQAGNEVTQKSMMLLK